MNLVDLVPIALGVVILVLSQVFPGLQAVLLPVGGALVGQGLPNVTGLLAPRRAAAERAARQATLGHSSPTILFLLALAALVACTVVGLTGCANTSGAVVVADLRECTNDNPATQPEKAAALDCLASVAVDDAAACLADLPQTVVWTAEELVCLVEVVGGHPLAAAKSATSAARAKSTNPAPVRR
jgi:hypothetical protein